MRGVYWTAAQSGERALSLGGHCLRSLGCLVVAKGGGLVGALQGGGGMRVDRGTITLMGCSIYGNNATYVRVHPCSSKTIAMSPDSQSVCTCLEASSASQ